MYKLQPHQSKPSETINTKWDRFLHKNYGNIQQTSNWNDYQGKKGGYYDILTIEQNDEIVAGCIILIKDYPLGMKVGHIKQGPTAIIGSMQGINQLCTEIINYSKKNNLTYLVVDLSPNSEDFHDPLLKNGFRKKPTVIPPDPIVKSTTIINIARPIDEIWQSIKKSRRTSITKALKSPIEFKVGNRNDIAIFYNLMIETCKRRNASPLIKSIKEVENIWDTLSPKGWIILHLTIVEGEITCASFGLTFGKTYINWLWGWNGKFNKYNVSEATDWHTILWAKENGFEYYDFLHIDKVSANAIKSELSVSEDIKKRPHFGSTFYKLQFGGKIIENPGAFWYVPNRFKYQMLQLGAKTYQFFTTIKNRCFQK